MKTLAYNNSHGFTLLELMVVFAIMGALGSIAIPHYVAYVERACAVRCLSDRRQIEMDESTYFLENGKPNLKIDDLYSCPSGGTYVWLISDPNDPGYPKVGCSIHHAIHYALIPSSPAEDELFSSDFDSMDNLTALRGKWTIEDGRLVPRPKGENRLVFGDEDWTDYEVTTNATLSKGKGYGIYYRSDGEKKISGYCFQYDPAYGRGQFIVRKVKNSKQQKPFQRVKIPLGFPVYNQSHEVSIVVNGDHHTIKIDGQVILDFHDGAFSSGSAGFRSWGRSQVSFENVTVT